MFHVGLLQILTEVYGANACYRDAYIDRQELILRANHAERWLRPGERFLSASLCPRLFAACFLATMERQLEDFFLEVLPGPQKYVKE